MTSYYVRFVISYIVRILWESIKMSKYRANELELKVLLNKATDEELAELEQINIKLRKNREYQQRYREKCRSQGDYTKESVQYNVMLNKATKFNLEELATFFGKTQRDVIEELINAKFKEHVKEILGI